MRFLSDKYTVTNIYRLEIMDQELLTQLVDDMRDLIKILRSTSGTGTTGKGPLVTSGTGTTGKGPLADDRSINRLINALGQLSTKLSGTTRTRAQELQAMKRFAANVQRATKQQEEQEKQIEKNLQRIKEEADARAEAARLATMTAKEIADEQIAEQKRAAEEAKKNRNDSLREAVTAARRQSSSSRAVFEEMSMAGGSAELLKNKFLDLGGNSIKAQAGLQLFAAGIEGTTRALTNYSAALYKGERGAVVSAKALEDLATPILKVVDTLGMIVSIGSFLVPGGLLVKGLVAAGGGLLSLGAKAGELALKFNKVGAEQADKLFKSFNELSTVGAATAGGMDDVFALMQTMGMTVSQIEEFNKLITSSGTKLAMMGATAGQGARRFGEVTGALYKSDLGRQLEMLGMTAEEQREVALSYMNIQARTGQMQLKNTAQLVAESGKFAKELDLAAQLTGQTRKEQQAAREAALAETRFRAALIDAEQRGDQAELERLQRAQRMAAIAKGMGDERGFTGILQAAAGQGALTTPEAVAAEMTYGVNKILSQPNITDAEMMRLMGANVKLQEQNLAGINRFIGGIDILQTSITAGNDLQRRAVLLAEGAAKAGFTGPDAISKFLETEQGKRIAAGGDLKLMVEAGRAQQAAAMTQDSIVKTFNGAADIHMAASKTFAEAVKKFSEVVGAKPVIGGVPVFDAAQAGGPGAQLPAAAAAAQAQKTANTKIEEAAAANDRLKEAEAELQRLKKIKASKEEQQRAEEKIAAAAKERERLEQEEIKAAREARQKQLEAKNARQTERRQKNAAAASGQPATATTPAATATPAAPGTPAPATPGKAAPAAPGTPAPAGAGTSALPGTMGAAADLNKLFIFTENTGSRQNFERLENGFKQKVIAAASDYYSLTGKKIQINSAHRSMEEQQRLWDETVLSGRPGIGPNGMPVAQPSTSSPHVRGTAIDIQNYNDPAAVSAFNRQGLSQRIPNDPVHFMARGGITRGISIAGEKGPEAVVPLPDGRTIPVTINFQSMNNPFLAPASFAESSNRTELGLARIIEQLGQDLTVKTNINTEITNALRTALADITNKMQPNQLSDPQIVALLSDMVNLQRSNNSTTSRLLQVSTA